MEFSQSALEESPSDDMEMDGSIRGLHIFHVQRHLKANTLWQEVFRRFFRGWHSGFQVH
jgi:hypothetical protein